MEFRNKAFNADCFDIMAQMPDGCVDLVLTDPPYAVKGKKCTNSEWDVAIDLERWFKEIWRVCKPTASIVCTANDALELELRISTERKYFRRNLVWVKDNGTRFFDCNNNEIPNHEYVTIFCKEKTIYNPQKTFKGKYPEKKQSGQGKNWHIARENSITDSSDGMRFPNTVLKFNRIITGATATTSGDTEKTIHPTQKPLSLWNYLVRTYSNEGDLVFDPFAGSGTTAVAAINNGRDYCITEMDNSKYVDRATGIAEGEGYFDVCLRRIAEAVFIPPPYQPKIKDQIRLF